VSGAVFFPPAVPWSWGAICTVLLSGFWRKGNLTWVIMVIVGVLSIRVAFPGFILPGILEELRNVPI
jgi:hypothetical protein